MSYQQASSLRPRDGKTLMVLGIARISTEHQDKKSLKDQENLYLEWLAKHYEGEYSLKMISGQGSGENLIRQEYHQAIELVESEKFDLVIAEDLGRISRRIHAQLFCELCEDTNTRLIAINDSVDTGVENWRMSASFATIRHEFYNDDTARRIRRSLRSRFQNGTILGTLPYGIIRPKGVEKDTDLVKDPGAQDIYDEMFRLLNTGASYSEVADWLNSKNVPTSSHARSKKWTCALLSALIHNPIIAGKRIRNRKISKRVNKTGKHISVLADPSMTLYREVPHLAFIDWEQWKNLVKKLDQKNAPFRRKGKNGVDTRKGVPKKRTRWPGQHVTCGICGRGYFYGGHGQRDYMMCSGAKSYQCWNGVTFHAPSAAVKMVSAILAELENIPDFTEAMEQQLKEAFLVSQSNKEKNCQELEKQKSELQRRLDNVTYSIREFGGSRELHSQVLELEKQMDNVQEKLQDEMDQPDILWKIPKVSEIRDKIKDAFMKLTIESHEFGRILHDLIPHLDVFPFQMVQGGKPVLQAKIILDLSCFYPHKDSLQGFHGILRREIRVDLYDLPDKVKWIEKISEYLPSGKSLKFIGKTLGIPDYLVSRTKSLLQKMNDLGISNPYVELTEPPENFKKMRRHLHPRYCFNPINRGNSIHPD